MKAQYHILNGDVLKERFPKAIQGDQIVIRECLIEGSLEGQTFEDFFQSRAEFIAEAYGGEASEYFLKVIPEFDKIKNIPKGFDINLWFEDDLFCQANFWFVIYFISHHISGVDLYLVRPKIHNRYGFSGLDESQLLTILEEKIPLEGEIISQIWDCYKAKKHDELMRMADRLKDRYPFMVDAVQAHLDRIPRGGDKGRPHNVLMSIIDDLKTTDFPTVFKEFCKREPIYGFGDLQVKRLLDQMTK